MRIQKSLIEDTISTKKAGLLLYSMQLALTNVGQTTFGQAKDKEMVRDTVSEEEAFSEKALSSQQSAISEKQNQYQNQKAFTAKDAENAKESKQNQRQHQRPFTTEDTEEEKGLPGNQKLFTAKDAEDAEQIESSGHRDIWSSENQNLPRMDADERGLKNGAKQVEWKPTPDMYRMDTPEGRDAYEASFRMTIASRLGAERRPPQPVIAPDDRTETHAVLG